MFGLLDRVGIETPSLSRTVGRFGSGTGSRTIGEFKDFFFDRDLVKNAVDRSTVKILSRFGAYVRTRAQRSMRRRKKASNPGQPPSRHQGGLRDYILFAYERTGWSGHSVVVGPILFGTTNFDKDGNKVLGTVPALHEYGGAVHLLQWFVPIYRTSKKKGVVDTGKREWRRANQNVLRNMEDWERRRMQTRMQSVTYPERPYMRPALAAERPKFAGLFRDSLGG